MKTICAFLMAFAVTGCASLRKDIYLARQQIYSGNDKIVTREGYGFSAQCPETWEFYMGSDLDPGVRSEDHFKIGILSYDKSPILQCDRLKLGVIWQDDLERVSARFDQLSSKNHRVVLREDITSFRGYAGHGRHWVKTGYFDEDEGITVFYPDGALSGCRLYIVHIGKPNAAAWREFDAIMRTLKLVK